MTLDVTIGGANSDSYATVAEADAYHVAMGNTAWAALTTGDKEIALRKGARYVDTYSFTGDKRYLSSTAPQRRAWPRVNAYQDGYPIDINIIPQLVKDAQNESSLLSLTVDPQANISNGSIIEKTLGPMTIRYSDYSADGGMTFTLIDDILAPLIGYGGGKNFHRVVRT